MILGSNRIIYIGDIEKQEFKKITFDELKGCSLARTIKVGTNEEMKSALDSLFEDIIHANASFKDYQLFLMELLTTVLRIAKDLNIDMESLFEPKYNLFAELYKFSDINEVKSWFCSICARIMSCISRTRNDTCAIIANEAKEYVHKHYSEYDLSMDKVCKSLNISPPYFCTIFKKEVNMTFISYLTAYRMEKAKELLLTTNDRAREIADKVGYSDPNYFSYCFKKNFNISPSEYRKEHLNVE